MDSTTVIICVVNGHPVTINAERYQYALLANFKSYVLCETEHAHLPPDRWEIRTEAGKVLSERFALGELPLSDGGKLFLNLKAGWGD